MKKYLVLPLLAGLIGCSSQQSATSDKKAVPLFEVLTQQTQGGASIKFFEVLTESKEINMLLGDEHLKDKIHASDLDKANFVILNMGEKSTGGYGITVVDAKETADAITLTVKETEPSADAMVPMVITYPYAVVKVNSKKQIKIE